MHYFEHHIGDYAAATSHLSLVEDAVYSRMLRRYYLTESPLPADWRQVVRIVGARTDEETEAVKAVLSEFFTLTDDGYRQKRADEVIAEYHDRQEGKAEERAAEAERKRRSRERRSQLFEQLREQGIVPAFNTPTDELVRMLSHRTSAGQDADGTAIHKPSPINQSQEKQKHVQPTAARFADFWAEYPNKKGKADAKRTWSRKGLDAKADDLIAHVRLMAGTDDGWRRGFVPMGSTYLNGDRWEDEPQATPDARAGPAPAISRARSAVETALDTLIPEAPHGYPDLAPQRTSEGHSRSALPSPGLLPG